MGHDSTFVASDVPQFPFKPGDSFDLRGYMPAAGCSKADA